jgi:hypothetical protein
MAAFSLNIPKEVFQPESSYKCWAAALESWLDIIPSNKAADFVTTMDDAVRLFAKKGDSLGGLDIPTVFPFMAEMVGMDYVTLARHQMHQLTGGLLYSRLRHKGHLYIVVSGGTVTSTVKLAHAGVIWAIADWNGSHPIVAVMDPIYGYVADRRLSYYRGAANAILGWPY